MNEGAVTVLLQEEEYVETLWADPVGPNLYRLDNSPFWAYGVSWKDVVEAHPDPDGMLRMTRVAQKSGHRTLRIVFEDGTEGLERRPLAAELGRDATTAFEVKLARESSNGSLV